jgi:hypothetical protein
MLMWYYQSIIIIFLIKIDLRMRMFTIQHLRMSLINKMVLVKYNMIYIISLHAGPARPLGELGARLGPPAY